MSAEPKTSLNHPATGTSVVLLHGAWHSSLHWGPVRTVLARHGLTSHALDMPRHGLDAPYPSGYLLPGQPGLTTERSGLADLTPDVVVKDLLGQLADIRRRTARLVLVAHSAGGGPASAVLEQEPGLADHVVYLSAFVPAGRPRFTDYTGAPENAHATHAPRIGDPDRIGAMRINPLSHDPAEIEAIRTSFLHDWPAGRPAWRSLLQPDETTAILSDPFAVTAGRWGTVPRSYVRLTDDRALPVATQDLMIAEADRAAPGRGFEVHSLPGGHSPFLTRPDELGGLLADLATRR